MLDLKVLRSALEQLEEERKIPKEKIIEAIEQALAAAYKKEYGKRGQIIRSKFDLEDGTTQFFQVKKVVDETTVRIVPEETPEEEEVIEEGDERVRYNEEHHIFLEDAQKIKKGIELDEEIIFPLETKDDFGRIAAQTAKQVIIQRIREAERSSIMDEYGTKEGDIVSGIVQKIERGIVYVDFNRATGILPFEEQIPGEQYRRNERIRAYLYMVEESPRGISLKLSRTHPKFLSKLFELEAPEIANGIVEIKSIAREAGSRSKIAVFSNDDHVDPVGSCVGQRGVRVTTVMNELNGEKIDIIPWSKDANTLVSNSLSPAKVLDIEINEDEHKALVEVADDQLSLAIGKGGQNVRLAAKLTGWKIDIKGVKGETIGSSEDETDEGYISLTDLGAKETPEVAVSEDTQEKEELA
ncbi:MAG: transcription termination/antitermination protein NusA [Candidatus Pacebacteria bacterium]|nr:transcription termination/antitermination protein NusA [Candidatus Paceibacterota bacterium]MBP9772594.1 transcription termination/antitermination protein NusA [Candidatus Paceibacterota bacterium]QQR76956.1 MAG: transcription termination/antitermination protein NusA [Candidatus Nomurabacteria bacterium]